MPRYQRPVVVALALVSILFFWLVIQRLFLLDGSTQAPSQLVGWFSLLLDVIFAILMDCFFEKGKVTLPIPLASPWKQH